MDGLMRYKDILLEPIRAEKFVARHKRYKSDSGERVDIHVSAQKSFHHLKPDMRKHNQSDIKEEHQSDHEVLSSLNQEILQLERRLTDQIYERCALEKALGLGCQASFLDYANESSMPKSTKELIRDIAVMELEVMHLEGYLLALYRKAFYEQITMLSSSTNDEVRLKQPPCSQPEIFEDDARPNKSSKNSNSHNRARRLPMSNANEVKELCHGTYQENQMNAAVDRTHSSLSYRSACSPSSPRAFQSSHSQPLSFAEERDNITSGVISLAEYLGANIADHVPETPNKISEQMVICMGAIYCKLADPPLENNCITSSPTSSLSSMSAISPQYMGDIWSPNYRRESSLDSRLINPFRVEGLKEFSGPYSSMVEIPLICPNSRRLQDVEDLLRNYNSLLHRLVTADPKKMKHEEKLAFWLNVHNALMMHTYLNYGIPKFGKRKAYFLSKARCIVGGHLINAEMIQGSILGCRINGFGQSIRTFLYPTTKFKSRSNLQSYAIEHPEPLLHFAVCSGSYSDPAVRIYTPKKLFEQLETAKEEYIRATEGIWKEQKILLPKVIDSYAKAKGLSTQKVFDMIECYLPETLRMAMQRCRQQEKPHKLIEWVPYSSGFRYLLSRELAGPHIS